MTELIVMRLADDIMDISGADKSRVCAKCGERVTIGKAGQGVLEREPDTKVICNHCITPPPDDALVLPAPGALAEVLAHLTKMKRQ